MRGTARHGRLAARQLAAVPSSEVRKMKHMHWQDAVTLLTGVGLIAAALFVKIPWPEDASPAPAIWNLVLVGAAAACIAIAALRAFREWEEAIELMLGIWLVMSPWAVGFEHVPALMWPAVIGGGIIAVMALTVLIEPRDNTLF
jgi:hypothetical protein